jgi:hypothetical protein
MRLAILCIASLLFRTPAWPAAPTLCITPGDVCKLSSAKLVKAMGFVPTATSISALEEFLKAVRADDNHGTALLVLAGSILTTQPGDAFE